MTVRRGAGSRSHMAIRSSQLGSGEVLLFRPIVDNRLSVTIGHRPNREVD
jgi:hypothetical protein